MTTNAPNVFRVGDVVVEPEANSIANSDGCIRIEPLLMDLLVFLARRPGRVVRREEIFDGVWQQRYVARSALTRAMALLRQALGDDVSQPRFIETIPKRGYRLIAPVEGLEPVAPTPSSGGISLLIGDCELPLSEGEHVIGRSDDAEVRIPAARISRRHARIVVRDGRAYLEDERHLAAGATGDGRGRALRPRRDHHRCDRPRRPRGGRGRSHRDRDQPRQPLRNDDSHSALEGIRACRADAADHLMPITKCRSSSRIFEFVSSNI